MKTPNGYKLIKNRQRPDLMWQFKKKENNRILTITTLTSGKDYFGMIEKLRLDGRYYSEFKVTCNTVDECVEAFQKYNEVLS